MDDYVTALCKEMELRNTPPSSSLPFPSSFLLPPSSLKTIYLGGGTPSQLPPALLHRLFHNIYKVYEVSDDAEITMECNPDDITPDYAQVIGELPINRVSMGAQTFSDERLHFLHRRHTSSQVREAVDLLRKNGIQNISIDLMFGFPGETIKDWERDIHDALALDVEHLSAYSLMIEEGTELYRRYGDAGVREYENSKEELEREMYELLIDQLTAAGYEHYEISNFAKNGFRSRHNSSYWNDTPYIGLGAAAHSYSPPALHPQGLGKRSWNVADISQYIEGMKQGKRVFEEETIDADTHYNDLVTVALRTREGLDLSILSEEHRTYAIKNARRFINDGLLELTDNHLHLTRGGLFVSDMIMTELMNC
jgi:oxygen-independent coproporphyrinogen-3 oxidase